MKEAPRYTVIESGSNYTLDHPRVKVAKNLECSGQVQVEENPYIQGWYRINLTDEGFKLFFETLRNGSKNHEG